MTCWCTAAAISPSSGASCSSVQPQAALRSTHGQSTSVFACCSFVGIGSSPPQLFSHSPGVPLAALLLGLPPRRVSRPKTHDPCATTHRPRRTMVADASGRKADSGRSGLCLSKGSLRHANGRSTPCTGITFALAWSSRGALMRPRPRNSQGEGHDTQELRTRNRGNFQPQSVDVTTGNLV